MKITLNTGRRIALTRIEQELTYLGVLAGRKGDEMDARHTQAALAAAQAQLHEDARPVLLKPAKTPLANVTCVGFLHSDELLKPDSEPYSSLAIVWFQDDFGLPIAEEALAQIKALDWESLARDWNW